ncbi:hypothetical protein ACJJTC_004143 [Scirpophaga incertulas]
MERCSIAGTFLKDFHTSRLENYLGSSGPTLAVLAQCGLAGCIGKFRLGLVRRRSKVCHWRDRRRKIRNVHRGWWSGRLVLAALSAAKPRLGAVCMRFGAGFGDRRPF